MTSRNENSKPEGRRVEGDESADLQQARAMALLFEVRVRGVERPATVADVLELTRPPRYFLKHADGRYIARDRKGWTTEQRDAMIIGDLEVARALRDEGFERGVVVKVVRLRRRGTLGIEGMRLRRGVVASMESGRIELTMKDEEAFAFRAALDGATEDGESH